MNIALLLTSLRLVLSPVFVLFFLIPTFEGAIACLAIAVINELTDLFDGMVARYRNEVTNLGKILDPLADNISRLTVFLCFIHGGQGPLYLIIFLFYRDSLVATIRTVCAYQGVVVSARKSGKIKAVVQATAILIILLFRVIEFKVPEETQNIFLQIDLGLIWIVALYTIYSAVDYLKGNWEVIVSQISRK